MLLLQLDKHWRYEGGPEGGRGSGSQPHFPAKYFTKSPCSHAQIPPPRRLSSSSMNTQTHAFTCFIVRAKKWASICNCTRYRIPSPCYTKRFSTTIRTTTDFLANQMPCNFICTAKHRWKSSRILQFSKISPETQKSRACKIGALPIQLYLFQCFYLFFWTYTINMQNNSLILSLSLYTCMQWHLHIYRILHFDFQSILR
jgi:hypothetical protein